MMITVGNNKKIKRFCCFIFEHFFFHIEKRPKKQFLMDERLCIMVSPFAKRTNNYIDLSTPVYPQYE